MLARLSVCLAFRCRRCTGARVQQFIHYCLANTLDVRSIIPRFAIRTRAYGSRCKSRAPLEFRSLLPRLLARVGKVLRRYGD